VYKRQILDSLPAHLPAARRQWDPFFTTIYNISAKFSGDFFVDKDGIAFAAKSVILDRVADVNVDAVLRDKEREDDDVTALRYHVANFDPDSENFSASAPGTWRNSFSRLDPVNEPELVSLSREEIIERIDLNQLHAPQTLIAKRIHLVDNQIDKILCITGRERSRLDTRLIRAFRQSYRVSLEAAIGGALRASVAQTLENKLGRSPTEAELDEAYNEEFDTFYNAQVGSAEAGYRAGSFPAELEKEITDILRFDLAPEEYAEFQAIGALVIDGKEIVFRTNAEGDSVPYYRDKPDGDPEDNLLSLPTYTPPFDPESV